MRGIARKKGKHAEDPSPEGAGMTGIGQKMAYA
jgi:hypothetical protein